MFDDWQPDLSARDFQGTKTCGKRRVEFRGRAVLATAWGVSGRCPESACKLQKTKASLILLIVHRLCPFNTTRRTRPRPPSRRNSLASKPSTSANGRQPKSGPLPIHYCNPSKIFKALWEAACGVAQQQLRNSLAPEQSQHFQRQGEARFCFGLIALRAHGSLCLIRLRAALCRPLEPPRSLPSLTLEMKSR